MTRAGEAPTFAREGSTMRIGRWEVQLLGGTLGCLLMILISIVASVLLTVLLNLFLR
jgi:hypothetical protein